MRTADNLFSFKPRAVGLDGSKLLLGGIAGIAALAIVGLLTMIVWMSLRTGVPGQLSSYNLNNYTLLLTDPYSYRVMMTTLGFAGVTIAVSVPLGFVFAWFIERTDLPHKALAMSLLGSGILFPTFLKEMGWVFLLHPRIGMINPNEGLPRYGLSGAYGTIMVGVSLILMIPYFTALKQSHRYQIISGKSYQSRPMELGR